MSVEIAIAHPLEGHDNHGIRENILYTYRSRTSFTLVTVNPPPGMPRSQFSSGRVSDSVTGKQKEKYDVCHDTKCLLLRPW